LPRHRRADGVAAVDVDDRGGRDRRVGEAELFTLEEKRRAAQREQHDGR
jgi:hypothetical protein